MNDEQINQIIKRVLTPINSKEPCGKWARYGNEFMSLSKSREEDMPNMPMGEWERPLVKADWKRIVDQCVSFLEKESKDLQIVIWLCDALIRTHQIHGLSLGLLVVNELISTYWETIWPLMDNDEELARVAPFIWLNTSFITRLNQDIILLQSSMSRSNSIRIIDWENSLKNNTGDITLGREKIRDSITNEDANWLITLNEQSSNSLVTIEKITKNLDKFLTLKSPSLLNLKNTIEKVKNFSYSSLEKISSKKINKKKENSEQKDSFENKIELKKTQNQFPKNTREEINSSMSENSLNRDKAYADLEKIADFLQKIEPHSPTPYLLNRLVKWKNMTLQELISDTGHGELLNGILGNINANKKKN